MNRYRPDYVVHEKTGLLAGLEDELGRFLDLLLQHPDLRRSMGEAAMVHVEQFTWESATEQWQEVFRSVMAGAAK
jgi:glycosyltransferase involved in cell wall biosynthesis